MKHTLKLFAVIVLVTLIGIFTFTCGNEAVNGNGRNDTSGLLTVIGLDDFDGKYVLAEMRSTDADGVIASATVGDSVETERSMPGLISNGTVTLNVWEITNMKPGGFSGTGDYIFTKVEFFSHEGVYLGDIGQITATFTNGVGTGVFSNEDDEFDNLSSSIIEGLTVNNYPKFDGSTSALPLNMVIACKLFGIYYKWEKDYWNFRKIVPNLSKNGIYKFNELIKSSTTHDAIIKLIDNDMELIIVARTISSDEKAYADSIGVNLIEIPIALDALVFIINPSNPIESLTTTQIQDIYTGKITNWNDIGWDHTNTMEIKPYARDANSGSQELMETLVMGDLKMEDFLVNYDELVIFNMSGAVDKVFEEANAICYTLYYYKEYIATEINVKSVTVDGIYPDKEKIGNNSYPFVSEVYAMIRSDLDKSSMAYKLYEWLQTAEGKQVINESGYVTN
jgi:phosphate transport system substrate-binding protein